MTEFDAEFPIYFDGSTQAAVELSASGEEAADEPAAPEEWRRYIGTNPYGADDAR